MLALVLPLLPPSVPRPRHGSPGFWECVEDWFSDTVVPILWEELKIAVLPEVLDMTEGKTGVNDVAPSASPPPLGCWGRLFGRSKRKVAPNEAERITTQAKALVESGGGGHGGSGSGSM